MKRNKKAIIITACIMFVGILLVVWGICCNTIIGWFSKPFYSSKITSDDVGKTYSLHLGEESFGTETDGVYLTCISDPGVSDEDYVGYWYTFDVSGISNDELMKYKAYTSEYSFEVSIKGVIREYSEADYDTAKQAMTNWLSSYYCVIVNDYGMDLEITEEEFVELEMENFSPYYIELISVGQMNGIPFIVIGATVILVSLLLEICFVFKLKKKVVLPIAFVVLVVIPGIILFNHIRTIASVKMVDNGIYSMRNYECTNTQGLIDANISSIEEFESWAVKEHFFNLPIEVKEKNIGCAAFAATTDAGEHLFGRNFDYDETDMVVVYSHPNGSYASIGVADLAFLGIGASGEYNADSLVGRTLMIVEPYAIMDGINEKGVGVGILELAIDEVHQDNGKPDMLVYLAMRAILDNCAFVDEALDLLGSYDIHTDLECAYHLFITDTTGKYVVVEWLDGEMVVTETSAVTNCIVAPGPHFEEGTIDRRLGAITAELDSRETVSEEDAMYILSVACNPNTEWSCVYNLEKFSLKVCLDGDYEKVYEFSGYDQ
ncbi:MAG: linear amide C-N hydrolase [Saccharofermentans sp.]|nr:linear amide C-N hydrolase [Saccharofermentans sp.]